MRLDHQTWASWGTGHGVQSLDSVSLLSSVFGTCRRPRVWSVYHRLWGLRGKGGFPRRTETDTKANLQAPSSAVSRESSPL